MDLRDILRRLAGTGRERERAAGDLLVWLRSAARGAPAGLREEVVCSIASKVLDRLGSGDTQRWEEPARYVRTMVLYRTRDLLKAQRRELPLEDAPEPAAVQEEPEEPAPGRRQLSSLRRALEGLFDSYQRAGLPRYRARRRLAWRQLCAAVFEGRALVGTEPGGPASDPRAAKRALDADYKAHQRLRQDLAKHLEELAARGELSPREAERLRRALDLLNRSGVRLAGAGSRDDRG